MALPVAKQMTGQMTGPFTWNRTRPSKDMLCVIRIDLRSSAVSLRVAAFPLFPSEGMANPKSWF